METMDGLSPDDRRALAALVERRMSDELMGGGRRGHTRWRCDGPPPPGEPPPQ